MGAKKQIIMITLVMIVTMSHASHVAQRKLSLCGGRGSSIPTLPDIHRRQAPRGSHRFHDLSRRVMERRPRAASDPLHTMQKLSSDRPTHSADVRKNKKRTRKKTAAHLAVCAVRWQGHGTGARQYVTRTRQQPAGFIRPLTREEIDHEAEIRRLEKERKALARQLERVRESQEWHRERSASSAVERRARQ